MTKNLNRGLGVAIMALASGAALYAQQNLSATIPFQFRTADGAHAAGTYRVISTAGAAALQLRNDATGKSVMLPLGSRQGGSTRDEPRPRLVFHCQDDGGCVLAEVWTGDGLGWSYPAPPVSNAKAQSAVVVYYNGEAAK